MANQEALSQLATRVPRELYRAVRLLCVKQEITVMSFIIAAITEKLKRDAGRAR